MSDRLLVEPPDEKGVAPSKLADENVADFRRCDASSLGTVGLDCAHGAFQLGLVRRHGCRPASGGEQKPVRVLEQPNDR